MKTSRVLVIFLVLLSALGLLTASLVRVGATAAPAASHPRRDASPEARRLALIGEETGLLASTAPVSEACTFDDKYQLYLCPEPGPAVSGHGDPAARAQALNLLDTTGLLLIPDSDNDRVMAFDALTGDLVDADLVPADPVNLTVPINAILSAGGDTILVSDQIQDVVQEYSLDGSYIGVFAPVGGVDTSILDNVRGIALQPNGHLLVTIGSGANAYAVAEFDTAGNYLGNFVANDAGGLVSPFDVYRRAGDWLVSGFASAALHSYDLAGAYIADFAPVDNSPEQITEAANGNALVGNFLGAQEGVVEFTPAGSLVDVYNPLLVGGGNRGVYELPNGNILTTNDTGVYEIDRAGNLVETKLSDVNARFIEPTSTDTGVEGTFWYLPAVFNDTSSGRRP